MGIDQRLKVLVDTNILLYVYDGFNPFEKVIEFLDYKPQFYITTSVLNEIKKFAETGSPIMQKRATVALKYLDAYKSYWNEIEEESKDVDVDTHLLNVCKKFDMVLFTNDTKLKRRAIKLGIKVLYLRQKSKNISLNFII